MNYFNMISTNIKCLKCRTDKNESEVIKLKCSHSFCWICINEYLKSNLNPKMKCPMCSAKIRDSEIRRVLSDDDIIKYEKICVSGLSKSFKCLLEQCTNAVVYTDVDVQYECSYCSLYNCIKCNAAHSFITCREFKSKSQRERTAICQVELERARQVFQVKKGIENRDLFLKIDAMDLLINNEIFSCLSCSSDVGKGQGVKLQNCDHSFCKACLKECIEISPVIPVHCPACRNHISDREIQSILSKPELLVYQEKSRNVAKTKLSKFFQCQKPNCGNLYELGDNLKKFTCLRCRSVNCVDCGTVHDNESCEQFQNRFKNSRNHKALQSMIDKGEVMSCPQCNCLLRKQSGCNWIRCTGCSTELCWIRKKLRWGPGFQYPTETSDQMNQDELQTRLGKTYEKLKVDLTKCKESGIEIPMKESLLKNVTDFLDLYDGSLRNKIKELHVLHNMPNNKSVSLNCLCVSINIVNLVMDQIDVIGSSRIISRLFSYLGDFQCQDKSNKIARRMQEMILYCLCNYYDNACQRQLKLIDCDVQWRDALESCFFQNQDSNKIKLSAAIVLSFNYHQMDPLKYQQTVQDYLTNIKSTYIHKETDKYLGIRGDLIAAAIRKFPQKVL